MAYTIVKTDGTVLTTISDGTINTTSTSLALPGRNYAGYGQSLDTNFVRLVENFADGSVPSNPLRGQMWYNTSDQTMYVCPADGESDAAQWSALTATTSGGSTTFGEVIVTGNIAANNLNITNGITSDTITVRLATVTESANIASANLTVSDIGTLTTQDITTGSATTAGSLTGVWTVTGSAGGAGASAINFNTGGIYINNTGNLYGIRTDRYMYANGDPISFAGTYSNSNVAAYLPTYTGIVGSGTGVSFRGTTITTGGVSTAGSITGNWTLTSGSRLNATYADLAERFEADVEYDPGTVVEIGGDKEITAVKYELSDDVFGVISDSAAYLMNAGAGSDKTHPPVAVSGRVQVKVIGKVTKGQRLVSAGNGMARAANQGEATAFNTIGRSLEDKLTEDLGTVEAIVMLK